MNVKFLDKQDQEKIYIGAHLYTFPNHAPPQTREAAYVRKYSNKNIENYNDK